MSEGLCLLVSDVASKIRCLHQKCGVSLGRPIAVKAPILFRPHYRSAGPLDFCVVARRCESWSRGRAMLWCGRDRFSRGLGSYRHPSRRDLKANEGDSKTHRWGVRRTRQLGVICYAWCSTNVLFAPLCLPRFHWGGSEFAFGTLPVPADLKAFAFSLLEGCWQGRCA